MSDKKGVRDLLEEYRDFARVVALESTKNVEYTAFGLVNEVEELLETMMPYFNDGITIDEPRLRAKIVLELGDILWYIVRLLEEIGIHAETFTEYWAIEELQICQPKETHAAVGSKILTMMRRAARICGYVKKKIRGDSDLKKDMVTEELKGVILAFMSVLSMTKISLREVVMGNVDKLSSRRDRGLLMGDGDRR